MIALLTVYLLVSASAAALWMGFGLRLEARRP